MSKNLKPKILYVTREAPFGKNEPYIIQELLRVKEFFDVIIVPVIPRYPPQYEDAKKLLKDSMIMPLINFKIFIGFLKSFISSPNQVVNILGDVLRESRSVRVLLRNLCVVPKAIYVSETLKNMGFTHIHAHWATIQTTFALIIARILGIPFSFTAHRYDIGENNMLRKKVLDAAFVRAISKEAKDEIIELTGLYELSHKVQVIHVGVRIPEFERGEISKEIYAIACPANLVEFKGHRYLVEACAVLKQRGLNFKCLFIGDGPERDKIESLIKAKGLENYVFLEGYYPHSKLMKMMEEKEIDVVVLPSIVTNDGSREGIPVTLMEAMSYGVPVVSTNTAGIPELLGGGSGIMVQQRDSIALADAIYKVLTDKEYRGDLIKTGYARVYEEFSLERCSRALVDNISQNLYLRSHANIEKRLGVQRAKIN